MATVNIERMGPMEFKLDELAERAGVSPRTVRYYIAQGLLPSPGRLGPMTRYGREHLDRLRHIKRLQEERLSLTEIRTRLQHEPIKEPPANARQVASEAILQARSPFEGAASLPPERVVWERITVTPDVELHVRSGVVADAQIDDVIRVATEILRPGGRNG